MKRRPGLSGCVAVGLLVACSGTENRLGGGTGNVAAPGGSSPAAPRDAGPAGNGVATATSLPSGFGAPDAPHDFSAGKWQGYIENYANANRSDSVLLELDTLSETSVTGKLVFGDATATVPDYSVPAHRCGPCRKLPVHGAAREPRRKPLTVSDPEQRGVATLVRPADADSGPGQSGLLQLRRDLAARV